MSAWRLLEDEKNRGAGIQLIAFATTYHAGQRAALQTNSTRSERKMMSMAWGGQQELGQSKHLCVDTRLPLCCDVGPARV